MYEQLSVPVDLAHEQEVLTQLTVIFEKQEEGVENETDTSGLNEVQMALMLMRNAEDKFRVSLVEVIKLNFPEITEAAASLEQDEV